MDILVLVHGKPILPGTRKIPYIYRLGTVNSKSFVGNVFLRIKWKFELYYTL